MINYNLLNIFFFVNKLNIIFYIRDGFIYFPFPLKRIISQVEANAMWIICTAYPI